MKFCWLLWICLFISWAFGQQALVLQTDFGLKDGAVAAMKGVAFGVDRGLPIFDLTHEIPAFDIWEGAYRLWQTAPYWPSGTVFVSVIDPGVGTSRKSVVLKTKTGHYFVSPDNGTLTLVAEDLGIGAVREIDEKLHRLPGSETSHTFHGRDVYVYIGARLAAGKISFTEIGPCLSQPLVQLEYTQAKFENEQLIGTIPVLDPQFGNVWTNIPAKLIEAANIVPDEMLEIWILHQETQITHQKVQYVRSFGDVPIGTPLLYINSLHQIALALNQGNFAAQYQIRSGQQWKIIIRKIP